MKITFEDGKEQILNEEEEIALAAMLSTYCAVVQGIMIEDLKQAATLAVVTEMQFKKETQTVALIGRKLAEDAGVKRGMTIDDDGNLQPPAGHQRKSIAEMFKE